MTPPVIADVILQHVSEAAFLWQLYDASVCAPHYNLKDLSKLDNRIEAHIDGLRIASDAGWELVAKQLEDNTGPGEAYVAALLAYESGKPERIDSVLEKVAPVYVLHRSVAAALRWLPPTQASRYLSALLNGATPGLRRLGLEAAVALNANPGLALEKGLHDLDLSLRARALRVVGEMGYTVWANNLRKELRHPDLACRFSAAWSLARLNGDPAAIAELQTITLAESTYRIPALNMLIRRLDPGAARKLITMLCKIPGAERLVLFAMGAWGDPVDVPYLLEKMKQTPYARIAAESFTFITGLNLAENNFDGPIPEDHEPLPNEDPLDDRVEMDPDENLPWPIVDKVQAWWHQNRTRFREGTRYLVGEPLSEARCNKVVLDGYQRQRAYAALELSIQHPGQPMIDVTARQK